MLSDLAFHLAARGWEVEVIASRQRYDDAEAQLPRHELERGVRITRIATTRFGRRFLPGRAVDYATFYLNAFRAMRASRDAIVVAMTDPPLLSVVAALAAPRVVNWIQDLFPEVAEGLGMRGFGVLRRVRDWSLRRAKRNVVLGERMAERLAPIATVVQHNWATDGLAPVARDANRLRREWGLGERFVVGYSGNLGRAHEFATIVAAARALPTIDFLIIGAGAQLQAVQQETRELANVQFRPYQPRELLSESLSAADVHLISLQPQLEGLIVPSKFYGVLAVARPAIFIGDPDGEVARLVEGSDAKSPHPALRYAHGHPLPSSTGEGLNPRERLPPRDLLHRASGGEGGRRPDEGAAPDDPGPRCGFVVEPGDAAGLIDAIGTLAADRTAAEAMGRVGRTLYDTRFAPPLALGAWERLLSEVGA